jgi:hypothetical protein
MLRFTFLEFSQLKPFGTVISPVLFMGIMGSTTFFLQDAKINVVAKVM